MTTQTSTSGKLVVERDGPVTTVTLNRPEVHNALDRELSAELNAAVREIAVDRACRVVVFRGSGGTFCAGDDIKEFNDWAPSTSSRTWCPSPSPPSTASAPAAGSN